MRDGHLWCQQRQLMEWCGCAPAEVTEILTVSMACFDCDCGFHK